MSTHAREPDLDFLTDLHAIFSAATPAACHAAIAQSVRSLEQSSAFTLRAAEIASAGAAPTIVWQSGTLNPAALMDWFVRAVSQPGRITIFEGDCAGLALRHAQGPWIVLIADSRTLPLSLEAAMRNMAGFTAQHLGRLRQDAENYRRQQRLAEHAGLHTALLKASCDLVWQADAAGVIHVMQVFHDRADLARRFDGKRLEDLVVGDTDLAVFVAQADDLRTQRVTLRGSADSFSVTLSRQDGAVHGTLRESGAERLAIDAFTLEALMNGRAREDQLRRETETMMLGLGLLLGELSFREKLEQLALHLAQAIRCDDVRMIQRRPGEPPRLLLPDGPALRETATFGRILDQPRPITVLAAGSDEARFLHAALTMRQGDIAVIGLPAQAEHYHLLCRARQPLSASDLEMAARISLLLQQALLLQNDQNRMVHAAKLSALGRMSTSIAHELRQPLNAISIAVQNLELMVEMNTATPEALQEKSARILSQVDRARKVMDHMRRFGRKTAGDYHPASLAAIVRSARTLMDTIMLEGGIALDIAVDDTLHVMADELEIEQVLVNLIQNGADAIHDRAPTGRIRIWATDDPDRADMVRLHVEDNGGGFPVAVLHHALDAFFTTKPQGKGTGLGLSVAHAILREHGGRLLIGNGDVDTAMGGARITLVLRRAAPPAAVKPEMSA